jgi:hypothetical protein
MRFTSALLRVLALSFGVFVLAAPGWATLVTSLGTGAQLAGGTVTVTFTSGGPITTALIIDNGGGQGLATAADGSFTFSVTGNTFTHPWTLTNNTVGNPITSVLFDLRGSVSLFDTTADNAVCGPEGPTYGCGTFDSSTGEPGALRISGPTITSSFEILAWPDPSNLGDMFFQERINWGSGVVQGTPATWYDDTDVVPEPASVLLTGIGLIAACLWRRRQVRG